MKLTKKAVTYLMIVGLALLNAVSYQLFIFSNRFAPAGLNGVCTMIQHIFGINVGYLNLLINLPLAFLVYKKVSRSIAVRSMTYVLSFSLALTLLEHMDLSAFAYSTETGTSKIMGPLVGGIIMGYCYSVLAKSSAYSGGTDFVAAIIHKYRPEKSVFYLIFTMNTLVAIASYFVYDYQIEPVILCILYSFTSSTVSERLTKNGRSAVRFEIITDYPNEISREIIEKVRHTTTLIPAKGMYSGRETNMLICVVNKTQVVAITQIIRKYPNTFAIMDPVSEVMGNFKKIDVHGKQETELLDSADGKTI